MERRASKDGSRGLLGLKGRAFAALSVTWRCEPVLRVSVFAPFVLLRLIRRLGSPSGGSTGHRFLGGRWAHGAGFG